MTAVTPVHQHWSYQSWAKPLVLWSNVNPNSWRKDRGHLWRQINDVAQFGRDFEHILTYKHQVVKLCLGLITWLKVGCWLGVTSTIEWFVIPFWDISRVQSLKQDSVKFKFKAGFWWISYSATPPCYTLHWQMWPSSTVLTWAWPL